MGCRSRAGLPQPAHGCAGRQPRRRWSQVRGARGHARAWWVQHNRPPRERLGGCAGGSDCAVTALEPKGSAPPQAKAGVRGEPACRPGSVHPRERGPAAIHLGLPLPAASCGLPASIGRAALKRSRRSRAPEGAWALVTLLRVGFTEPPGSLRALVVSYTTVSPLPRAWPKPGPGRSVLCGTVPRVTPGRCYRPPCPVEPGPSSPGHARTARRGRPAGSPFPPRIGACAPRVANSRPARGDAGPWGDGGP